MCKLKGGTSDDQVKLRLFDFSLINRAKDWLQCIPNCIIHTWKELEENFLKRYYSNVQFVERKVTISNFDQEEAESLSDACERFKLLLCKSPILMNDMKQLTHFIGNLKIQTRMLLKTSVRSTLRTKTNEEMKIFKKTYVKTSITRVKER